MEKLPLFIISLIFTSCVVAPPEAIQERGRRTMYYADPPEPRAIQPVTPRQQEVEETPLFENGLEYDYYFIHTPEGPKLRRKIKAAIN